MEFGVFSIWHSVGYANGVVDPLASWPRKFNRYRYAAIWAMIPHCLMWRIWWEMNTCTFEGSKRLIHDLKLLFFQTLSERTNAGFFPFNSLADLLDSCNFLAL